MHRKHLLSLPLLGPAALALAVAGCGGGGGSGTASYAAPATRPAVTTAHTSLGRVLVDARGRSVYLFEKDKPDVSACSGTCASLWPPVQAPAKLIPGAGIVRTKLGLTRRKDGRAQVTYAGHPLYTYAGDTKPGQVSGQGLDQFGAAWYVLSASGRKVDDD